MNMPALWVRRLPLLLGLGFCLTVGVLFYQYKDRFHKPPQLKKAVQQFTMLQPPPPPPPPPEQKQPEPDIRQQKMAEPEAIPEQQPKAAQPPSEQPPADVADGNGESGPNGWNMQAGEVRIGGGGNGVGGNQMLWYGGQIQRRLEDGLQALLAGSAALKSEYSVLIDVWVDAEGAISRAELAGASGQAEVDRILSGALGKLRAEIGQAPPGNMPQPVRIRFTVRI